MLLLKSTEKEALDKLTEGHSGLTVRLAMFVLEDTLNYAKGLGVPFALDIDAIKNAWFEESESYVLEKHEVEELEDLNDIIYYMQPEGPGGDVYYMYLDDDNGVYQITDE